MTGQYENSNRIKREQTQQYGLEDSFGRYTFIILLSLIYFLHLQANLYLFIYKCKIKLKKICNQSKIKRNHLFFTVVLILYL